MSIERSIRKHFQGDEDIMYGVIAEFCKELPKSLDTISSALINKNCKQTYSSTHLLRGSVSIFFMKDLDGLLMELENKSKLNDLSGSGILFDKIKLKLKELCVHLDAISKEQKKVA